MRGMGWEILLTDLVVGAPALAALLYVMTRLSAPAVPPRVDGHRGQPALSATPMHPAAAVSAWRRPFSH